jgi:hypothetical protein
MLDFFIHFKLSYNTIFKSMEIKKGERPNLISQLRKKIFYNVKKTLIV